MADRAFTVTLNGLAARLKHLAEVLRRANKLRVYCKEFLFFANKELYRLASESTLTVSVELNDRGFFRAYLRVDCILTRGPRMLAMLFWKGLRYPL